VGDASLLTEDEDESVAEALVSTDASVEDALTDEGVGAGVATSS
jgi:hypothetical protein